MSEGPYLPKDGRRRIKPATRTLAFWVFLVLVFLAVYQVFTASPGSGHSTADHSSDPTSASWIFWGGGVVLLFGWIFWARRRMRSFNAANAEGLQLVAAGDFDGAVARFEELFRAFPRPRSLHVVAGFNLGIALARRGDLDRALAQFVVLDPHAAGGAPALCPSIAVQIASVHALRGDLETSERWLAEYEVRKKGLSDTRALDGLVVLVRSVAGVRRGRYEEIARDLEARWRELESVLTGETLRSLRVLRAFAVAQASGPRGAGAAETVLAGVRPSRRGEFAELSGAWPEMRAFLETNGL